MEESFCLLLRQSKKQDKKSKVQLFLAYLLVLLALADRSYFCVVEIFFLGMIISLTVGLTISLPINRANSISGKVVISFFG